MDGASGRDAKFYCKGLAPQVRRVEQIAPRASVGLFDWYTYVMKRLILASQSPRRKQLLGAMGVEFETIPSAYDEHLDDSRDPETVAKELALGKAMDVAKANPDAYVIGSDTIVTIDGHQLEKPISQQNAREMLELLAGRPNYVTTGVAIVSINNNVHITDADTAAVFFKPYDKQAVDEYIATGDPMDKAGGYGMQHPKCAVLIDKFDGRYDTIIGLPSVVVSKLLADLGIKSNELDDEGVKSILAS